MRHLYLLAAAAVLAAAPRPASAHPLGNFTVNQYTRVHVGSKRLHVRHVVDMAEVAALPELQDADADRDGKASVEELDRLAWVHAPRSAVGLRMNVDGKPLTPAPTAARGFAPPGEAGLLTLRLEVDLEANLPPGPGARKLTVENRNHPERLGWRELAATSDAGVALFDGTLHAGGLTDELRAYPPGSETMPLNERSGSVTFGASPAPAGAAALDVRSGGGFARGADGLTELIKIPELTPWVAFVGLLIAFGMGGAHALSPGHGKTVVGAYLIGNRGTARHAAFLGLTVTLTHTLGVFLLGLVTLYASRTILPERLYPVLSLLSGAIILALGGGLLVQRSRALLHPPADAVTRVPPHDHPFEGDAAHGHTHTREGFHSHEGGAHSHLPPGTDGAPVTWRSLLAIGISGGLLPCPSALMVLLAAIGLNRVGYGLLLVVAFSMGLAAVLTTIGLAFVYAGRLIEPRVISRPFFRIVPVFGAAVITVVGAVLTFNAARLLGVDFTAFGHEPSGPITGSALSVLGLGLVFGVKHALEADHLAAVATIASERKSILSSSLVGGLWGLGHTISLLIAGVAVILLHLRIPDRLALALEFCVALMLVTLAVQAIRKLRRGDQLHVHPHAHGGVAHSHPHWHESTGEPKGSLLHHRLRFSARPILVGMIHGLAGSAALMLLVLTSIPSAGAGFLYLGSFGLGSIGGMMVTSGLVGVPLALTSGRWVGLNRGLRTTTALLSLGLGISMIYTIGWVDGLFR